MKDPRTYEQVTRLQEKFEELYGHDLIIVANQISEEVDDFIKRITHVAYLVGREDALKEYLFNYTGV